MEINKHHILLFHIGTPKTGSSAIQQFLYTKRKDLLSLGWSYLKLRNDDQPDINNGIAICDVYDHLHDKDHLDEWKRMHSCILRQLEISNVIISHEGLWIRDYFNDILRDFKERGVHCKVIVYLRRQDRYLETSWNQQVKIFDFRERRTLADFFQATDCNRYHYFQRLKEITNIIGDDALIVRLFERDFFQGETKDVVSDFLFALNIPLTNLGAYSVERINASIDWDIAEIKRMFNTVYHEGNIQRIEWWKSFFEEYYQASSQRKDSGGMFRLDERRKFLSMFAEENREIARQFFHRENGVLFQENDIERPCTYHETTPFEAKAIQFFFSALIRYQASVDMKLRILMEVYIAQQKKLAYFGGGKICQKCMQEYHYPVSLIIDNYLAGHLIHGVPVVLAKNIHDWHQYLIIITCDAHQEIGQQLTQKGLVADQDYITWIKFF